MTSAFRSILLLALLYPAMVVADPSCPPSGYTKQELLDLRQTGFKIVRPEQRNALALDLLGCVGDPDPAIRDGVVFEGYSTWLRAKSLDHATTISLLEALMAQLSIAEDPLGFIRPFAALGLSEVARVDRVEASFTDEQRQQLVDRAAAYLKGVTDYRGFSNTEGWRHGVAHGSDLVLQLVLNENIDHGQVEKLVAAVFEQVSPSGEVSYIHGEPNRLARAIYYAYKRNLLEESHWSAWISSVTDPAPLGSWNEAYSSQADLARRHNTLAFLMAMYVYASSTGDEHDKGLAGLALDALGKLW